MTQTNTFNLDMTIGDSVTQFPELVKVYMDHGIDFCCGGFRSVREAIEKDAMDLEPVVKAAEAAIERAKTVDDSLGNKQTLADLSSEALIDNILRKHHGYLKQELPILSELAFKLLMVHGENHNELFEVHEVVNTLRTELEAHLVKEEVFLFPQIKARAADVSALIEALDKEHTGAGDALHHLTELTDHFTTPADGCQTYKVFYDKLKLFVSDMYIHVHKENNILFPRLLKGEN